MWRTALELFQHAIRDVRGSWRVLAITDLAYKAIAFAVLTPATTLLLYWLRARVSEHVVADVDIAMFFLTTPTGIVSVLLGTSLIVAITAVEVACLMAVGVGQSQGVRLNGRGALRFGASNAFNVLRLSGHMVLRVILALLPFALAGGVIYMLLLRAHDINYYLSRQPAEYWIAVALITVLVLGFAWLLVRTMARWAFALALVVFEGVHPRRALSESAKRGTGSHGVILFALAMWAISAAILVSVVSWLGEAIGLAVAPRLAFSLPLLLVTMGVFALLGLLGAVALSVVNTSLFAQVLARLYLRTGQPTPVSLAPYAGEIASIKMTGRMSAAVAVLVLLGVAGVSMVAFLVTRRQAPVVIIAHRGSSATAPENTLAAFNLAAEQKTDLVELDVQESSDGVVLVAHDADLMKVAGNPVTVWGTDTATLRAIDIGSYKDARFASERLPTLAEALAACKGRCKVLVELKSYGHNRQLEQRVAEIVEAAGMQNDCEFMSLDHAMVKKMKELRPHWRVGILVAKAIGDLTDLKADFLAVESRMASRRFVRRAHQAGQDVYIWTANDPAWMLLALARGVDGLITDKPDLTRKVIETRARMSDVQRFVVAVLIRFGASTQVLAAEDALRP